MDNKIIQLKEIKNKPEISLKNKPKACFHGKFEVDSANDEVRCGKCGKKLDPITVLSILAYHHSKYFNEIAALEREIAELKAWNPHRRIIKKLSEMLTQKMYPQCPICAAHFSIEEIDSAYAAGGTYIEEIIKKRMASKKQQPRTKRQEPAEIITELKYKIVRIASKVFHEKLDKKQGEDEIDKICIEALTALTQSKC